MVKLISGDDDNGNCRHSSKNHAKPEDREVQKESVGRNGDANTITLKAICTMSTEEVLTHLRIKVLLRASSH